MQSYTVEVTWRVPEYTHLTVQAERPNKRSNLRWKRWQTIPTLMSAQLDYEGSGPDVVTGLWEGDEAYPEPPGSTLPLPPTPERDLETAIEAAVAHVRQGCSAPVELHNLLAAFDTWRRRADATLPRFASIRNHQRRGIDNAPATIGRRPKQEERTTPTATRK